MDNSKVKLNPYQVQIEGIPPQPLSRCVCVCVCLYKHPSNVRYPPSSSVPYRTWVRSQSPCPMDSPTGLASGPPQIKTKYRSDQTAVQRLMLLLGNGEDGRYPMWRLVHLVLMYLLQWAYPVGVSSECDIIVGGYYVCR